MVQTQHAVAVCDVQQAERALVLLLLSATAGSNDSNAETLQQQTDSSSSEQLRTHTHTRQPTRVAKAQIWCCSLLKTVLLFPVFQRVTGADGSAARGHVIQNLFIYLKFLCLSSIVLFHTRINLFPAGLHCCCSWKYYVLLANSYRMCIDLLFNVISHSKICDTFVFK